MNKWQLLIIFIGLVIFLAGCVKETPPEAKFKNDVVTIPSESYFVSNLAPYEKGGTNIQFGIHNNGDQKIPYLEVDFFDLPGFIIDDANTNNKGLDCNEPIGKREGSKCVFQDNNALEPLDARSIKITLNSIEDVSSPTPHTLSFAVRYVYFGSREAGIPVIDGQTRKQPLTKFRQSDPSTGPIVLDIYPAIEREVVVGDKTIKKYWGIGGENPLPFLTKFKFKHVGSLSEKVKDVNISASSVRLNLQGLKTDGTCDFCERLDCRDKFKNQLDVDKIISENKYFVDLGDKYYLLNLLDAQTYSTKPVSVPFDTLLCTFKPKAPESLQPEYTATISAIFTYKYEFIKSQDFVIQPLPS